MADKDLLKILQRAEDYGVEFKEARSMFSKTKLNDYCAAISNEEGGWLVLGADNQGRAVGTAAFTEGRNKLARQLTNELGIRIKVYEVRSETNRLLFFEIPKHPSSVPIQATGGSGKYRYPIRDGDSIVEMSTSTLQEIFSEQEPDWSAEYAPGASIDDLDMSMIDKYRTEWAAHTKDAARNKRSAQQMLNDLQLMQKDKITNAAMLLFGKPEAIARYIPDAEIIFEWRNNDTDIAYGDRREWKTGFMGTKDDIWSTINARNSVFRYNEGFAQREIPSFDEKSIREAVVNAFVHRDYTIPGRSIHIKASPKKLYIDNPGRLMPGVTVDNIFDQTAWRNRRLAEALEKVGIMERSSQGIDTIFRVTIESGKGLPELRINPDPTVALTIPAILQDQSFIAFLENITKEKGTTLSVKEVIELEEIRIGVRNRQLQHKNKFISLGVIERVGQGRGTHYILSHRYYSDVGSLGQHTRLTGLSREMKKATIMEHLKKHGKVTNAELQHALPDMTMEEISSLLKSMAKDDLIVHHGARRYGYWTTKK